MRKWLVLIKETVDSIAALLIRHSLRRRLMLLFIVLSLTPLIVVGAIALLQSTNSLEQATRLNLEAVRNLKAKQVDSYFKNIEQDIQLVAGLDIVSEAYRQMTQAYTSVGSEALRESGYLGHPELVEAPIFSTYNLPHKKYHELFAQIASVRNYTDILLISRAGDVIYSYAKQDDFGTNLETDTYRNTALSRMLAEIVNDPTPGKIRITDYEPYLPDDNNPDYFIGTPLVDKTYGATGILVYKISIAQIDEIMQDTSGVEAAGETYLVGTDKKIRTGSLLGEAGDSIVDTVAVEQGLNGEFGVQPITNYRGESVLSAYQPVKVQGQTWVLVTEVESRQAFKAVNNLGAIIIGLIILTVIAIAVVGYVFTNRFVQPIIELTAAATAFSKGDLEQNISTPREDEIGVLFGVFNDMAVQLKGLINSLEGRVADRTHRLEMIAVLGERLSAILDLEELMTEVVVQIREHFGYYYAHIYLLNDQGTELNMVAGIGSAGKEMKRQGHRISINAATSLVARAARTGQIVRVDDVRQTKDWLPNPLLPDTCSEMAVPIISSERGAVIGVLDVQEDKIGGLGDNDAAPLRFLANQVAVAIHNARLFSEVESALAEAREAQEKYVERAWQRQKGQTQSGRYIYVRSGASFPGAEKQQAIVRARDQALKQPHPTVINLNDEDEIENAKSLVAPITLNNRTIGTLQLHNSDGKQLWNDADLALVETVMDQLAQAAENLRLFEQTRDLARQELLIREITEKLRAAPNLDRLVNIATEELGKHFSASYARLTLGVHPTGEQSPSNGKHSDLES